MPHARAHGHARTRTRAAADHVVRELGLAADKVAAHYGEPAKYPLPADRSAPEHLLAERFYDVPDDRKKWAAATVLAGLAQTDDGGRGARLGVLARVDLRSPASVEAQASRLPLPEQLAYVVGELHVPSDAVGAAEPASRRLELRVRRVLCRVETDEWGADPVRLTAVRPGPDGAGHRAEPLEAGRFNCGDTVTYAPPRLLHRSAPATGEHLVLLVLATQDPRDARDGEALADHVDRLLALARRKLGALLGPADPGLDAAACAVVGELFDRLRLCFGDDTFRPVTLRATAAGAGVPEAPADFRGHGGHYQVTYDWRLSA